LTDHQKNAIVRTHSAGTGRAKYKRGVAQLVARLLWEQEVRGSSPRTPTTHSRTNKQPEIPSGSNSVVEFLPSKQAVAGSSPVSRSTEETVSVQALLEPPENNQAARRKAGDGFVLC
jgi:hypothetical protein